QFNMDGHGLGKMIRKYGPRGAPLLGLPAAAAARGVALSVLRLRPQWIPYYLCFGFFNYAAMLAELVSSDNDQTRAIPVYGVRPD
ncbi:MAG: hypothetical protein J2P28_22325, partial [Actinobacteria bacterium]|nr:hypothetical protein [Actinomycetota bacterium]